MHQRQLRRYSAPAGNYANELIAATPLVLDGASRKAKSAWSNMIKATLGTAALGGTGYAAKKFYDKMNDYKGVGTYYPDGTSSGKRRVGRKVKRRRKKKSTKQLLRSLKRNLPKMSRKTFRAFKTMCMSASDGQHVIFEVDCVTPTQLRNAVSNLTLVDTSGVANYATSNSAVKINWYYKLMAKNNAITNQQISYRFYKCSDDDTESYLQNVREESVDRGYTVPALQALTVASATNSERPLRLICSTADSYHLPISGGQANGRKWTPLGPRSVARISPGDTLSISKSGRMTYRDEVQDDENFTYLKGFSIICVIDIVGELAHKNEVGSELLVGRSGYQLDCEQQLNLDVIYANPKGLKEVVYSDTLPAAGIAMAHADNYNSAIETTDKL